MESSSMQMDMMDVYPSETGQSETTNMQLLSVPSPGATVGSSTSSGSSRDAKFLRRYSCNPQGKAQQHSHHPEGSSSPMLRRSSLAAIKWGVLARRISSLGVRETPEDPTKAINDVNTQVAYLRDLLIHMGNSSRDGPEMRERIRRVRRNCIESVSHAVRLTLSQLENDIADGIPMDFSPQLVLLFFCTQLLVKELRRCRRLVIKLPVDMTSYYESGRPGLSNFAGVFSQLAAASLCRPLTNPDFIQEEICSIDKDTDTIQSFLDDMQEFMPKENSQVAGYSYEEVFGRRSRRRRNGPWCDFEGLCCISKSRRLSSGY